MGEYLENRLAAAVSSVERLDEDAFLSEPVEQTVERLTAQVQSDKLVLHTADWVNADVQGAKIDMTGDPRYANPWNDRVLVDGTVVVAEVAWEGNRDLFLYRPSTYPMVTMIADVRSDTLAITHRSIGDTDPEAVKRGVRESLEPIARSVEYANQDVEQFNASVEANIRSAVERRRGQIMKRRDLAGNLGFPVKRREDAPRLIPLERKVLGPKRRDSKPRETRSYQDEVALDHADYEDILTLTAGMLRAFENTPSVVISAEEESLRDQILVQLNGTYQGAASGETFVKSGKTDIVVQVEGRHVFVAECKWWDGTAAFNSAIDQLLGYLPWRDEKAALIVFIGRKNVQAVIDKVDAAVRAHPSFLRATPGSHDPSARRDYVLAHPDDPNREIHVAVQFAAIPEADRGRDD